MFSDNGAREFWDDIAEEYDSLYTTEWCWQENAVIRKALHDFEGRTLDVACGTGLGYVLLPLAARVMVTISSPADSRRDSLRAATFNNFFNASLTSPFKLSRSIRNWREVNS